ncbi:MAG: hypothetical protein CVU42_03580 [Chloroflexi bacterium HGW-Chloroflexi-4]|jgi:hypothetical protein|nr:MAG: hypothetical protein CVU42_03580 [Chloroflexi bacterium HGW-Chloroflexi-4]
MTYRSEYSYSKTLSQIDSIKEDFVRLSGYASQLTEIDPSIICQPKAVKRIKDIQRFLKFIEGIFYELRSMFEIGDDIDSQIVVSTEEIFTLIGDYSHNKDGSQEQNLTSELTDSILRILTSKGNNQRNPDRTLRTILYRQLIDYSMQKAAEELDQIYS